MVSIYSFLALGFAVSTSYAQRGRPGGGGPPGGQQFGPPGGFGGPGPSGPFPGQGKSAGSPAYPLFSQPLPIPQVAQPDFIETTPDGRTVEFYTSTVEPFQHHVYPNLGPANLVGYNGTAPGPTYRIQKGHETVIRYLNKGTSAAAVHLHGSYTHAPWDGWAADEIQPGSYKDYYYPNSETARSIWYHDHSEGITSTNAYYGQAGAYIIYDPAEDVLGLPKGNYDLPLALSDKTYQSNGDLASPNSNPISFFGDTIQVNEMPWPFLNVEPRKYRFRFYDMSLSRPYDLFFADPSGNTINFQVIASDSGLFASPVTTNDVTIAMGERYEVVFDFSAYTGKNITLKNAMATAQINSYANTDKVMMFIVGNSVSDSSNNGPVPSTLNGAIDWPEKKTTVDHTFNFQMGGDDIWTINGIDFDDVNNRVLARPPQGATELWQLHHTGGPAVHPVHVHLVNMQVISRTGGSRGLLPYEAAGMKDIVLLEPGETVQVIAQYAPWNGLFMFHCHNLIHEDHAMLDAFNVTLLQQLGYDFNTTIQFSDPMDSRFSAQKYSEAAYAPAALSSAVSSFAALSAYVPASSLLAAESSYYKTASFTGEAAPANSASKTVAPVSSGAGFASTTTAATTGLVKRAPSSTPAAAEPSRAGSTGKFFAA